MAAETSAVVLQHGNRLVREVLAGHLMREPGIDLVGTASSGPELIQLCKLRRPGIVVFEVDVLRWSNERLIALLRQSGRQIRIIGVHDALPAGYAIRAYEAGVSALVSYASGLDALLDAVKIPSLPVEVAREDGAGGQALTEQELRLLYLISAGYPPREIATELGISLNTVQNHKKRIFSKLNVHNQAHAAASAVRLGLHAGAVRPKPPYRRKSRQRRSVSVVLTAPASRLVDDLREVLSEHDIPVLDEGANGSREGGTGNETLITVLVNPRQSEWRSLDGWLVIVDSRELKRSQVTKAFASGIAIVPASRIDDLLVPAVHAAGQGYVLANSTYVRALFGPPHADFAEGWRRWELALTPREKEILASISRGHVTKQTARLLGISARTVENLQSNLFKKLRVHNRAAALVVARDLGLLDE
ncbi:LuxR C-terminal-related transcriptional regulator [Amycolatopsis taiwanensis]|uniref:LuxR C-terminal-related transcriptional regulator n=1 Tax=Amycolatopsis taiwanensis TaxID=342230 RepID=UPI00047F4708|nr:LuxR C-terminal-related transcriptional regulator [Amycolatopsis taiwanensis]